MSEWLKETGCKPVGYAYAGSNPAPPIRADCVDPCRRGSYVRLIRRRLLLIVSAALVAAMFCAAGADAASVTKCKAPKGTRAPTKALHAGYATSCATARKVAKAWDSKCEPSLATCSVTVGANRRSCRNTVYDRAPYRSRVYAKCALKETTRGRPSVNFFQAGAVHKCERPQGVQAQIRFLTGYYAANCGSATAVAQGWDAACEPGEDQSTCGFDARGEHWNCQQFGRPGVDASYSYFCTGERTGGGRTAVTFAVRIMPLPPGVPDEG